MADYWDTYQDDYGYAEGHEPEVVRYAFDADEWEEFPVAAIFETYREAYQLTMEDVATALKIRIEYIYALERGDYDALPGKTFAVGYVRSIANFLQLPCEVMVVRFKAEAYQMAAPTQQPFKLPEPPRERQLSRGLVVLVSLVILTLSWGLWLAHNNGWVVPIAIASDQASDGPSDQIGLGPDPTDVGTSIVLAATGPSVETISQSEHPTVAGSGPGETLFGIPIPKVRPASSQAEAEVAESVDEPRRPRVVIEASALAWIQVRDANQQPIVAQMLQAGEQIAMPAQTGLTLTTGSIEALTISVDNQAVALPLPDPNTVVTQLALDPASLQNLGAAL